MGIYVWMCGATLRNFHGDYVASKTRLNVRQLAIALLRTESQMG